MIYIYIMIFKLYIMCVDYHYENFILNLLFNWLLIIDSTKDSKKTISFTSIKSKKL
jgi:hypothetical protein